ncbi:ABC transporter permease [Actinotalea ferrariae]|uniref:ABC transporter permease n=1 Tax=Actinotalea ferrariae TaxID=1386098 RepID=UPI001C8CCE13|nr:ABC transporter permease [Actinotalea ferrariae]MBX9244005.1 ABC transporter permease [Actinotalea ferrariae]
MTVPPTAPPVSSPVATDGEAPTGGPADLTTAPGTGSADHTGAGRAARLRARVADVGGPLRRRFRRRTPTVVARGSARDRFRLRDLITEAAHGIGARPGRLVLTIVGTVLGVGSLVVTVGLAQTAAGQIARQFDAVAATQAIVEPATARTQGGERATGSLPWDVEDRLIRIAGVEAAGAIAPVSIGEATITAVPVNDPSAPSLAAPQVVATTPGLLDAVRGRVVTGRYFDAGHDERADRVVVLGARAATRLGVHRVDRQPSIFIGEESYTVIGIVDDLARRSDLLDAVIMPIGTARAELELGALEEAHVTIAVGAGPVLAEQAPIALSPNDPESMAVQVPPSSSAVRENVQADINAIFLALGAVALLVGGLGIANITLLSVRERIGEIGLRRALGASKRDIGSQFLVESVVIGLLGGLIGAALGVFVVVLVSLTKEWTPILDTMVVIGAALLGGVIGLGAGTYPALKAAGIEPIAALRGGT